MVKTLFPQKLKILESPTEPVFFPLIDDPKASAASSIKTILFSWDIFFLSRTKNSEKDSDEDSDEDSEYSAEYSNSDSDEESVTNYDDELSSIAKTYDSNYSIKSTDLLSG